MIECGRVSTLPTLFISHKEKYMPRAFDASKFRKNITKSVPGMSVGFRDPDTWISTGNYTLNKLISNDFHR